VLSDARARERLLAAVAQAERLVLLGDTVELRERPWREVLRDALPTLSAIGEALPPDGSIVLVGGNHDHGLLAPALARRSVAEPPPAPLGSAGEIEPVHGEPLAHVCAALGADRVRVRYPGTWLGDDVYATHGHHLDRHTTVPTLERLAIGAIARHAGERPGGPACAEDYEAVLGPVYALLDAYAGAGARIRGDASVAAWRALAPGAAGAGLRVRLRRRGLRTAFSALVAALQRVGFGPLSDDVSIESLRRSALVAVGEVLLRLRIDARVVVFGHTHRAGPLHADDAGQWRTATGTRLLNCGCWVRERTLAGSDRCSPYRPGFCVRQDDAADPVLVNLLDAP
jgi:predicted phosphodiesterase